MTSRRWRDGAVWFGPAQQLGPVREMRHERFLTREDAPRLFTWRRAFHRSQRPVNPTEEIARGHALLTGSSLRPRDHDAQDSQNERERTPPKRSQSPDDAKLTSAPRDIRPANIHVATRVTRVLMSGTW